MIAKNIPVLGKATFTVLIIFSVVRISMSKCRFLVKIFLLFSVPSIIRLPLNVSVFANPDIAEPVSE